MVAPPLVPVVTAPVAGRPGETGRLRRPSTVAVATGAGSAAQTARLRLRHPHETGRAKLALPPSQLAGVNNAGCADSGSYIRPLPLAPLGPDENNNGCADSRCYVTTC